VAGGCDEPAGRNQADQGAAASRPRAQRTTRSDHCRPRAERLRQDHAPAHPGRPHPLSAGAGSGRRLPVGLPGEERVDAARAAPDRPRPGGPPALPSSQRHRKRRFRTALARCPQGQRPGPGPAPSSRQSAWATAWRFGPASCPPVRPRRSHSPGHWRATPPSCCSTNRCQHSTQPPGHRPGPLSASGCAGLTASPPW
jgi:hypothetical protein